MLFRSEKQLEKREQYSWANVCIQLKKMYEAAEIVNYKWTDKDTTKAYLDSYVRV